MSKITEVAFWEPTVYQADTNKPNKAGPAVFDNNGEATDGFLNAGVQQVTNRTAYLKETLDGHIGSRGAAHTNATQTEAGFMSDSDKTKLNGVETGAQVNAPPTVTIVNKTAAYTVVAGDLSKVINCTSGTFTVALTAAATLGAGFNCWVWNTSVVATDVITVDPNGVESIDGGSTLSLRRGEGLQVICDGTTFYTGSKKIMRGYAENASTGISRPVASGDRGIAIGTGNSGSVTAGSTDSFAAGNNSSGAGAVTATGAGAMALGGSYASGVDSFAAAIGNNTSSYGATGINSVAIGRLAKATGANSVALSYSSVASGSYSFAISDGATASGVRSVAIGNQANSSNLSSFAIGYQTTASGSYSLALGANSVAAQQGKQAFASGRFSANGDAQSGKMVLRKQTTDATSSFLTSDGGTPTAATRAVLPDNSVFAFRILVTAMQKASDGTNTAGYEFTGVIRRGTGVATTAIKNSTKTVLHEDVAEWDCFISASTGLGSLDINVVGAAATNIAWVATVDTTEVTYA